MKMFLMKQEQDDDKNETGDEHQPNSYNILQIYLSKDVDHICRYSPQRYNVLYP